MKDSYTQVHGRRGLASHSKDRFFTVSLKLICTNETFQLTNIYNDMKIKELKSYCEFMTGIPLHLQKLNYLDQGDLLDHLDVKSCDLVPGATLHMDVWNMWRRLVEAVASNDADWVFHLGVTDGSDYNTPNSDFMGSKAKRQWLSDRAFVALYIASHRGHNKLCEKLMEAGLNIDTSSTQTAQLHWPNISNIAVGANVNCKTPLGRTALHVAAARGHGNIVDYLLEKGADINSEDVNGDSALSIANKFGNKDCERHLFLFRWQQRAKQTKTQAVHEKFAHQYNDSAFPVWLKGDKSQLYFSNILPPGEFAGTSLGAPRRSQSAGGKESEEESCDSDEDSMTTTSTDRHKTQGDRQRGMPAIKEESNCSVISSAGGRNPRQRRRRKTTKGTKDKDKKTNSFDDWLQKKKETEQRRLDTQRLEKQQKKIAEDDKQRMAEMQDKSYEQWLAEKEVPPSKAKVKVSTGPVAKPAASSTLQTTEEVIKRILARREKEAEERGEQAADVEQKFNFWMSSDSAHLYKHIKSHGPSDLLHY